MANSKTTKSTLKKEKVVEVVKAETEIVNSYLAGKIAGTIVD